jgi:hypothetical protein
VQSSYNADGGFHTEGAEEGEEGDETVHRGTPVSG